MSEEKTNGIDSRFVVYSSCYRPNTGNRKGVFIMELLLSFIIAVAAGVVSHLINKWFDGDK